MARYNIVVEQKNLRETSIEKLVADLKAQGAAVSVQKVVRAESRADRLSEALSSIESARDEAASEVEALRDEIEEWKSGMEGTNLEQSNKYSELEECYDALEEIISQLEDLEIPDASDVMFPGMY